MPVNFEDPCDLCEIIAFVDHRPNSSTTVMEKAWTRSGAGRPERPIIGLDPVGTGQGCRATRKEFHLGPQRFPSLRADNSSDDPL